MQKFCIQIHYGNLYFVSFNTSEMNTVLAHMLKLISLSEGVYASKFLMFKIVVKETKLSLPR